MPRMSSAESRQRAEEQRLNREHREWAEFSAEYPRRLLMLVFEYSQRAELSVSRDQERDCFVFSRHREMCEKWFPVKLDEPNRALMRTVEEAESQVAELVAEEQEAQRLYKMRQQALSKLSAEERAALNF
jgi:hypothetical protein